MQRGQIIQEILEICNSWSAVQRFVILGEVVCEIRHMQDSQEELISVVIFLLPLGFG